MAEKTKDQVIAPDPSAWKSVKVLVSKILGNSHYVASITALIVAIAANYKVSVDPAKVEQVLQILKQLNDQPLPPPVAPKSLAPVTGKQKAAHVTFVVEQNPPANVKSIIEDEKLGQWIPVETYVLLNTNPDLEQRGLKLPGKTNYCVIQDSQGNIIWSFDLTDSETAKRIISNYL